jgi:hypothetical protein
MSLQFQGMLANSWGNSGGALVPPIVGDENGAANLFQNGTT